MMSGFTTEPTFGCLGQTYDRLKGRELFQVGSPLISALGNADFVRFLVAYEH